VLPAADAVDGAHGGVIFIVFVIPKQAILCNLLCSGLGCICLTKLKAKDEYFFVIPFYLPSVSVHSANCVKIYAVACRRVLSNAPL
jgi:hypothetical protein